MLDVRLLGEDAALSGKCQHAFQACNTASCRSTDPRLEKVPLVVSEDLSVTLDSVEHGRRRRLVWVVKRLRQLLDRLTQLEGTT